MAPAALAVLSTVFLALLPTVTPSIMVGRCEWWGRSTYGIDIEAVDIQRFSGKWYEIMQDSAEAVFLQTTCAVSDYQRSLLIPDLMTLSRTFKFIYWIPWYSFPKHIHTSLFDHNVNVVDAIPGIFNPQHEILATDYDNFAVKYGCTNYLGVAFHIQTATLLSRTPHIPEPYVTKAKHALKRVNYWYNVWWGWQFNLGCRYTMEDSGDKRMIQVFSSEPDWGKYYGLKEYFGQTDQFRNLYDKSARNPNFPSGIITEITYFQGREMGNNLKWDIDWSYYNKFYHFEKIQYERGNHQLMADIWLLAEGLSEYELGYLDMIYNQNTHDNIPICCLRYEQEIDYSRGMYYDIEWLLSGYARVVVYNPIKGIVRIEEGHFYHGIQDQFGRFYEASDEKNFGFVGYFPSYEFDGVGISLNRGVLNEGAFPRLEGFAHNPKLMTHLIGRGTITDFKKRTDSNQLAWVENEEPAKQAVDPTKVRRYGQTFKFS